MRCRRFIIMRRFDSGVERYNREIGQDMMNLQNGELIDGCYVVIKSGTSIFDIIERNRQNMEEIS